jgi:hypothetical protein
LADFGKSFFKLLMSGSKMLIFYVPLIRLNLPPKMFCSIIKRKIITVTLIAVSIGAFATLGEGSNKSKQRKSLLSTGLESNYNYHTFSLKSGSNYRGNTVFSATDNKKYVMMNTVVTYQKGNATYILPMKKRVLMDNIKFSPSRPAQ